MSSDPTDLIRNVDERHQPAPPTPLGGRVYCKWCDLEWPCEVRRLRDAFEAEQGKTRAALHLHAQEQQIRTRVEAALAEAKEWAAWFAAERDQQAGATKLAMTSLNNALDVLAEASGLPDEATEDTDFLYETVLGLRPALAEANATIERFSREVDLIGAHRIDWEDNGPAHDEWLASFGERRLGGPDIAYRGIQYAVARLRRALKREP